MATVRTSSIGKTAREVRIQSMQDNSVIQEEFVTRETLDAEVTAIKERIAVLDTSLSIKLVEVGEARESEEPVDPELLAEVQSLRAERTVLIAQLNDRSSQRTAVKAAAAIDVTEKVVTGTTGTGNTNFATQNVFKGIKAQNLVGLSSALTIDPPPTNLPLIYNASSVNESYFSADTHFSKLSFFGANTPKKVSAATELWSAAKNSKGMIVTSQNEVTKAIQNATVNGKRLNFKNYGFQFMYNPGTISMTYATTADFDITTLSSGTDKTNLIGQKTPATINFQIIVNRIFDMKHYNPNTGALKNGHSQFYANPPETTAEQKEIYTKGTMYDVEYLLKTLLGFTLTSYLRGQNTADVGWIGTKPVELHLGTSLRYYGTVQGFSVNHTIFDERMVPLFTTINIQFSRLPDMPFGAAGTNMSGNSGGVTNFFGGGFVTGGTPLTGGNA
jgi:hypothetical protein